MNCPVCGSDMSTRSVPAGFSFKSYHVCPDCRARYTADNKTKQRALLIAIFALVTAGLSAAGFLVGFPLGIAAFGAGIGLLLFVGYTLSKISYVQYRNKR